MSSPTRRLFLVVRSLMIPPAHHLLGPSPPTLRTLISVLPRGCWTKPPPQQTSWKQDEQILWSLTLIHHGGPPVVSSLSLIPTALPQLYQWSCLRYSTWPSHLGPSRPSPELREWRESRRKNEMWTDILVTSGTCVIFWPKSQWN